MNRKHTKVSRAKHPTPGEHPQPGAPPPELYQWCSVSFNT